MSTNILRPVVYHTTSTFSPVRGEKEVKKVRDYLASWASSYKASEVVVTKKTEKMTKDKVTKVPSKTATYTSGTIKRSQIPKTVVDNEDTINILARQGNMSALLADKTNIATKHTFFTVANFYGSAKDIGIYLSTRLSRSASRFDQDITNCAVLSFLNGALSDNEALITVENLHAGGKMKVLRGFEMYAKAVTDSERYDAITTLYNDFVVGVIDKGADIFANVFATHIGFNNLGQYNTSIYYREQVYPSLQSQIVPNTSAIYGSLLKTSLTWATPQLTYAGPGAVMSAVLADPSLKEKLTEKSDADFHLIKKAFERGASIEFRSDQHVEMVPVTHVDRSAWLNDRGVEKATDDSEKINLVDIPAYAAHLGLTTQIYTLVPAAFRPVREVPVIDGEARKEAWYPLLGLNPKLAYKLIYPYGIAFNKTPLDYTSGHTTDSKGNVKKILSHEQAREAITKHLGIYFNSDGKKPSNIIELLNHKKYLSVSGANFEQANGVNIAGYTDNTTGLLFPDNIAPQIMSATGELTVTKEEFMNRPDLVFALLLYSIGVQNNKVAIDRDSIQDTIRSLYNVFSDVLDFPGGIPATFSYNTIPVNRVINNSLLNNYSGANSIKYSAPLGVRKTGVTVQHISSDPEPQFTAPSATPFAAPGAQGPFAAPTPFSAPGAQSPFAAAASSSFGGSI